MSTWKALEPVREQDACATYHPGSVEGAAAASAESDSANTSEETIFSILAARAQSHSRGHLALTAVIGLVDAVALGWAHPALWSVAAVLAAGGAYGAWGLADRALSDRVASGAVDTPTTNVLRILRELTALLGLIAVLAALGGIWDASLGGWRH